MPKYRPEAKTELLYLDGDMLKNTFYLKYGWFWPAMVENPPRDRLSKPHKRVYHKVIGIIGTNPDDPRDLGGKAVYGQSTCDERGSCEFSATAA